MVPLRSLTTHPAVNANPLATEASEETVPVQVALNSTKVPFHFEIEHLGKPLWAGDAKTNGVEKEISMRFPNEGVDLFVSASWSDAGPAVLKITVTPGNGEPITKMLWGDGNVSDVLTFK